MHSLSCEFAYQVRYVFHQNLAKRVILVQSLTVIFTAQKEPVSMAFV